MLNLVKLPVRKSNVALRVAKGHFATSHSHINYLIDVTFQKSRLSEAQAVAKALVKQYVTSTIVDTIVCLDGMQVVGACLAEELTKAGFMSINAHQTIYVITPELNSESPLSGESPAYAERQACPHLDGFRDHRPYHRPEHGVRPLLWRQGGRRFCHLQRHQRGCRWHPHQLPVSSVGSAGLCQLSGPKLPPVPPGREGRSGSHRKRLLQPIGSM